MDDYKFALIIFFKDKSLKTELFFDYASAVKRAIKIENGQTNYADVDYVKISSIISTEITAIS